MPKELISVIVPCYNQANYLPEALDSLLNQKYDSWECIIVDDGSPDDTKYVADIYCKKDNRFKYVYQSNLGLAAARNTGIRFSKGKYIFPLDSDDKIHPDYFTAAIEIFYHNPDIGIVYCVAEFFGEKKGIWELLDYSPNNILLQSVIYASAFFKRVDFDKTNGYDSEMIYGWEDWEFWLSMVELGLCVYKINRVYFYYRFANSSMTRKITNHQKEYLYKIIYLKHHKLYDRLFKNPFQLYFENEYYRKSNEYRLGYCILYPFNKIKLILRRYV